MKENYTFYWKTADGKKNYFIDYATNKPKVFKTYDEMFAKAMWIAKSRDLSQLQLGFEVVKL